MAPENLGELVEDWTTGCWLDSAHDPHAEARVSSIKSPSKNDQKAGGWLRSAPRSTRGSTGSRWTPADHASTTGQLCHHRASDRLISANY